MRVIEIYETGRFPQLVLDSKKAFASNYGLERGVLASLRRAAVARGAELPEEQPGGSREPLPRAVPEQGAADQKVANYGEAARWYGQYIASFRNDAETPAINYQLADLQLENQDFAAQRASTSARPTTTRSMIVLPPQATRPSTRIASI